MSVQRDFHHTERRGASWLVAVPVWFSGTLLIAGGVWVIGQSVPVPSEGRNHLYVSLLLLGLGMFAWGLAFTAVRPVQRARTFLPAVLMAVASVGIALGRCPPRPIS